MDDNELFGNSEQLNDTISRAAAINAICEDGTQLERQGRYSMTMVERKQRDADILDALPSAKPVAKDTNVPVKDCISRRAAVDAVINLWADKPFGNPALVEIKDCIEALPSAQQWIPCSERLPEEGKAYLVTFANEKVGMSSWHKDTFNRGFNRGFDAYLTGVTEDGECEYFGVVAWMEKPEPWKGEET